jgi:hypothetical protein
MISLALLLLCLSGTLDAQVQSRSVGIKSGDHFGFNGSLYQTDHHELEASIGFRKGGVLLSARVNHFNPLNFWWSEGFSWYYGYGAHFGNAQYYHLRSDYYPDEFYYSRGLIAGINGSVGLQYKFDRLPFSARLEVVPFVELYQVRHFNGGFQDLSFVIKYHLN